MALTRKMLAAMDIPAEKIDEIINAHVETVNGLKEERDTLQEELDKTKNLKADLEEANKTIETLKSGDYEKKFTDLQAEFDDFKSNVEKKETLAKKEAAYKKILNKAGVSEKRIDAIMKVSVDKIAALDLDDKGEVVDADKAIEDAKTEWADFTSTEGRKGADTATPPNGDSGKETKPCRAAELAAKYHENLYGKGKEN